MRTLSFFTDLRVLLNVRALDEPSNLNRTFFFLVIKKEKILEKDFQKYSIGELTDRKGHNWILINL